MSDFIQITIQASIKAPMETVWACWNDPEHIIKWNSASDDWHTPKAQNDLREGGKFVYRMESVDGKMGFDFGGTYTEVVPQQVIGYTMDDNRTVRAVFSQNGDVVDIVEVFDAEGQNSVEMQREGWQSILNRFKTYVEAL